MRTKDIVEGVYGSTGRDAACVAVVGIFDGAKHTVARIGDCSAFSLGAEGLNELFADDATFVNLVRTALLDGPIGDVETVAPDSAATLVLCSNGLANDLRTSPTLRAWLEARWQRPTTAYALLDSLRYRRQGSHDDRTVVVVWPRADAEAMGS